MDPGTPDQCAQCQNADATVHITVILGPKTEVTHLCEACAAKSSFPPYAISSQSETCSFCDRPATFSVSDVPNPISCCESCSREYDRIFTEECKKCGPEISCTEEFPTFAQFLKHPEFIALSEEIHLRTVIALSKRKSPL